MPALHTATGVLHPLRVTVPHRRGTTQSGPKQSSHRSICIAKGLWPALSGFPWPEPLLLQGFPDCQPGLISKPLSLSTSQALPELKKPH